MIRLKNGLGKYEASLWIYIWQQPNHRSGISSNEIATLLGLEKVLKNPLTIRPRASALVRSLGEKGWLKVQRGIDKSGLQHRMVEAVIPEVHEITEAEAEQDRKEKELADKYKVLDTHPESASEFGLND